MCVLCKCACSEDNVSEDQDFSPAQAPGGQVSPPAHPTTTELTALTTPYIWPSSALTFSFPNHVNDYFGGGGLLGELDDFLLLSNGGKEMVRAAFEQWEDVSSITLTELTGNQDGNATIRVAGSGTVSTAWAYFPDLPVSAAGDIWIGVDKGYNALYLRNNQSFVGSYEHYVAMHEFGHAVGLKHPHQTYGTSKEILSTDFDSIEYTVMSYRSYLGDNVGSLSAKKGHFPQTLMMLDIAAIQAIYGANYTTNAGQTVYSFTPGSGQMFVNGSGTGKTVANVVFRTLWDGGGEDTIDLGAYGTNVFADLSPGGHILFDTENAAQRAHLGGNNNNPIYATANLYMSLLHEGNTRSLIENVVTGSGDDAILGNQADNKITPGTGENTVDGGSGSDTVILTTAADAITVNLSSGNVQASYANGSTVLTNVEYLESADGTWGVGTLNSALAKLDPGAQLTLGDISGTGAIIGTVQTDLSQPLGDWYVFIDADGDTRLDSGEIHAKTDADGSFQLGGLSKGTYSVALTPEPSVTALFDKNITVKGGQVTTTVFTVQSGQSGPPAPSTLVAETGTLLVDNKWQTVTLSQSFVDPVVFAMVETVNGLSIVIPRIKKVTSDSFDIRLQESHNLDGVHSDETVSYIVMEAGRWELADGTLIEVGSLKSDTMTYEGFDSVSFATNFADTPYLFSTIQSFSGSEFVTTRHTGLTADGFGVALEEEEAFMLARNGHSDEKIGWMAIDDSAAANPLLELVTMTPTHRRNETSEYTAQMNYDETIHFVASATTWNGSDSMTVRGAGSDEDGISLFLQEDTGADSETNHAEEDVSVLLFTDELILYGDAIA
ncbi:MAG: M10 family metallopeptidase [Pseudomonadota bacterium]